MPPSKKIWPRKQNRTHVLFEILVREHHRLLLAYARSLAKEPQLAEDLVQEAFVIAWEKFAEFDVKRDFGAWLRGIIRYEYLHWARKKKEIALEEEDLEAIDAHYATWHSTESSQQDLFSAVRACVAALPEPLQKIIQLTYTFGFTGPEVASGEGVSEEALRKRLQRAREKIASCLEQRFQISPDQ